MPCTPPPTAPNVAERMFKSTVAGSGLKLLNRLKNSVRNSNERASLIRNFLLTEKSTTAIPGNRIASVRGAVPNRPKGVCWKAPVLNQRFHVRWSPGRFPFCPATRSGLEPIPVPVVSTPNVIGAGKPLWKVMMVLILPRSEEHTSELQSPDHLVCRLLLEKKKNLEFSILNLRNRDQP